MLVDSGVVTAPSERFTSFNYNDTRRQQLSKPRPRISVLPSALFLTDLLQIRAIKVPDTIVNLYSSSCQSVFLSQFGVRRPLVWLLQKHTPAGAWFCQSRLRSGQGGNSV